MIVPLQNTSLMSVIDLHDPSITRACFLGHIESDSELSRRSSGSHSPDLVVGASVHASFMYIVRSLILQCFNSLRALCASLGDANATLASPVGIPLSL